MSFKVEPLDNPELDFDDADTAPQWVVGSDQRISWRTCFIVVYESGNRREHTDQHKTCTGSGTVPKGTELFLGGKGGRVKQ